MSDGRLAGGVFAAAFLIRLTAYLGTDLFGTDSAQFLLMADWMRDGQWDRALSITYHPLYPAIIAGVSWAGVGTEAAGFWVSMTLGAAATVPLFYLARDIFGRPVAFVTALLYGFQPHLVNIQSDVMTEGTFCFFLYGAAWLTWRSVQSPTLLRHGLAGIVAACAYLTRPEGILACALAVAWPMIELIRRKERIPWRAAGIATGAAAMLLAALPFLMWVHGKTGAWRISAKGSVAMAGMALRSREVPRESVPPTLEESKSHNSREGLGRYGKLARAAGLQVAGPLFLFFLLGIPGLRGPERFGRLLYFSYPVGYLAGLILALRTHPWMSYRYVLPPMGMMLVVAALGMVGAWRWLSRRWPGRRTELAGAALMLAVTLVPCVKFLRTERFEGAAVREAGSWIRAREGRSVLVMSTFDQIGWFAGERIVGFQDTWQDHLAYLEATKPVYLVYRDRDLERRSPAYLDRIKGVEATFPSIGADRVHVRPLR